jgi:hypothetical protein
MQTSQYWDIVIFNWEVHFFSTTFCVRPDYNRLTAHGSKIMDDYFSGLVGAHENLCPQFKLISRRIQINIYFYSILGYLFILKNLTKLHGLSLRANYTDRATADCRRSDCQLFSDIGCHVVNVMDPYGCILGFLDRSRYFSFK